MVRCESKNGHQKDIMCLREIGHRAQLVMLTVPSLKVNISGGTYMTTQ